MFPKRKAAIDLTTHWYVKSNTTCKIKISQMLRSIDNIGCIKVFVVVFAKVASCS